MNLGTIRMQYGLPQNYSSMGSWGNPIMGDNSLNQSMGMYNSGNIASTPMQNFDLPVGVSGGGVPAGDPSFLDGMIGYTDAQGNKVNGWGGLALGAAQTAVSGYMGWKQLQLAKSQLKESKRQFNLNFGAQQKLTNSRLEDRQRARVAYDPGGYESVSSYMQKNGI